MYRFDLFFCWIKQDLNEQIIIYISICRGHKTVTAGIQWWNKHQTFQDGDWTEGLKEKRGNQTVSAEKCKDEGQLLRCYP